MPRKNQVEKVIALMPEPTGHKKISAHMLKNAEFDTTSSLRTLALHLGIDFAKLKYGEKRIVNAQITTADGIVDTTISFRRTPKRGDRRIWIGRLNHYCKDGDTVAVSLHNGVLVVNIDQAIDQCFIDDHLVALGE
mgnify:FL=1